MYKEIIEFIKSKFIVKDFIPLHEPKFIGNEKKYLLDAIDSTYVSSVGPYVDQFEKMMTNITGAGYAVAIVNGTNALHIALISCGVKRDDEVISQALTFVATANAISYIGASPVFVDVDKDTLGMSPNSLENFLVCHAEIKEDGFAYNKITGRKIAACLPMHTFGFPCRIDKINEICTKWNIALIEDAAESLGSYYNNKHTGTFGRVGVFSLNGNKTVTCGGGGAIVTEDETLAKRIKHLTTQAKIPHKWEFRHDEIGYNYRMPNINAALACAQLEMLEKFIINKRELAVMYSSFFNQINVGFIEEIEGAKSNYWLNAILLKDINERNNFLELCNDNSVMARPVWELMNTLPMFSDFQHDGLINSVWLADRLVNIPSSVR
jgi:perosamine synthetase